MSLHQNTGATRFLLVAGNGSPVAAWVDSLRQAGASVDVAADVYSAMAHLASNNGDWTIVVDAAGLDPGEASFITLAPLYHSAYVVLHGEEDARRRIASLADCLWVQLETLLSITRGQEPEYESTKTSTQSGRSTTLSTDGLPQDVPAGPTLHDAVRDRMAGDRPPPVRRPPQGAAPSQASPSRPMPPPAPQTPAPPSDIGETTLSPAELDALLAADEFGNEPSPELLDDQEPTP